MIHHVDVFIKIVIVPSPNSYIGSDRLERSVFTSEPYYTPIVSLLDNVRMENTKGPAFAYSAVDCNTLTPTNRHSNASSGFTSTL